jgi:hypothetical protein
MSAIETVKEIGRIASTTTLGKDVIDLLEEKIALLTEQVTTLETENKNLKAQVYDLEQELRRAKPKRDLADDTIKALRLFFDCDLTVLHVAQAIGLSEGMADYHCGVLAGKGLITLPGIMAFGVEPEYYIIQAGREYLVKHGLV